LLSNEFFPLTIHPLGSLQRSPDPVAGFKGPLRGRGERGEGREGVEDGKGNEGERGMEKGEKRGEVGGIAPWLLGDRRPCLAVEIL